MRSVMLPTSRTGLSTDQSPPS